jgi:hypothetical protein
MGVTMTLYDAFISYSHAKDKPIAAALQSAIQNLGKPWLPWLSRDALRLFRDDTSLSATPHLWPTIELALGQSRYFILLASPEAAASRWVDKEVAHWLENKSVETLLIGLTDGELTWDDATSDFARVNGKSPPLPAALAKQFSNEPKWVDLRQYREGAGNAATKRNAKFIELAANFAAPIRGLPKEDILSEKLRQQRRASRLVFTAAVLFLVVAAGAIAGWVRAERRYDLATDASLNLMIALATEQSTRPGNTEQFYQLLTNEKLNSPIFHRLLNETLDKASLNCRKAKLLESLANANPNSGGDTSWVFALHPYSKEVAEEWQAAATSLRRENHCAGLGINTGPSPRASIPAAIVQTR